MKSQATQGTFDNPTPRQRLYAAMHNADTYSVQRRWLFYEVYQNFVDEELAESINSFSPDKPVEPSDVVCFIDTEDMQNALDRAELTGWSIPRAAFFLTHTFEIEFPVLLDEWGKK